jgi:hypothetical protein
MTSILNRLWRSRARFLLVVVWITSLGVTFLAGAIAFRQRDQIRRLIGTAVRGQVIRSEYYNIAVKMLPIPGEGRDGGIEALDAFAPQVIQSFVMATPLRLREKLMMRPMIRR